MLSILIPVYNYDVYSLVEELHSQCKKAGINFEIIVIDDASTIIFNKNKAINQLPNCSFLISKTNMGRSVVRNLLSQKAQFENLLFLDADTFPVHSNFILTYISQIDQEEKIIYGGILYEKKVPQKDKILRWVYGNNREALNVIKRRSKPYLSFLTLNFLIHKNIFDKVSFNETIPNLRHEDTLFSYNLMQKKIKIIHLNNPVYHFGLDVFEVAIQKEKESLFALKYLIDNELLPKDYVRISKIVSKLKQFYLIALFAFFYKIMRFIFLKNLASTQPSLLVFDLYRLGYLCQLETNDYVSNF